MRQFCFFFACFLLLTLTFASYVRADDEIPIVVQRFSDRVILLTDDPTFGETTVAIASNRGLVVIDTSGSPESAVRIRRAIEQEFGRSDFAYVINTHHHWDHTSGNQAFADAVIIGHDACYAQMLRGADPKEHILNSINASVAQWDLSLETLDPESERAQRIRAWRDYFSRSY